MALVARRTGPRRRMMADINVVPYVDVMLVLVVILMVAAPFVNPSMVELPSVAKAGQQKEDYRCASSCARRPYFGDRRERDRSRAQLVAVVRERQGSADTPVVIEADVRSGTSRRRRDERPTEGRHREGRPVGAGEVKPQKRSAQRVAGIRRKGPVPRLRCRCSRTLLFIAIAFVVRWKTEPVGTVAAELWRAAATSGRSAARAAVGYEAGTSGAAGRAAKGGYRRGEGGA